jgi:hypothetical protein
VIRGHALLIWRGLHHGDRPALGTLAIGRITGSHRNNPDFPELTGTREICVSISGSGTALQNVWSSVLHGVQNVWTDRDTRPVVDSWEITDVDADESAIAISRFR